MILGHPGMPPNLGIGRAQTAGEPSQRGLEPRETLPTIGTLPSATPRPTKDQVRKGLLRTGTQETALTAQGLCCLHSQCNPEDPTQVTHSKITLPRYCHLQLSQNPTMTPGSGNAEQNVRASTAWCTSGAAV